MNTDGWPCMCGDDSPPGPCGDIAGTGCPKLPGSAAPQGATPSPVTRGPRTSVTRDEDRPPLRSPTSSLVPSNSAPSNTDERSSPSNTFGETPEVEALLSAHEAGRGLPPVEVKLSPLPPSRSALLAEVADLYVRVRGLRLAYGDERPVPFAAGWIARKLGLEKQTAYRLRRQLVAAGVLVKAGTLPGRVGPDGHRLRGTDCYLPGELPREVEEDAW